jgi:ribosomal protein S12 methylthiotransferase
MKQREEPEGGPRVRPSIRPVKRLSAGTEVVPPAALSVGFISLGCAKNLVDSEHMATVLRDARVRLAASPETADIILINTCGFIGDAKKESIEAILRACALKETGTCKAVIVAGCLTQRYREELRDSMPEVDAFIGLDQLEEIARVVRRLECGERDILRVSRVSRKVFNPRASRIVLTGGPFSYLKIAEGCNHRCAFCAIPGIRGRFRSRAIDDVVREAELLLGQGVRELNLISQDTTRYGCDRSDGADLPKLLRALGRLGGRFWIRLLYGHPGHLTDELLETMGAIPQVCRYLDVPIQHSHPDILKGMRRAGGAVAVREFPVRARRMLPGVTLRTTCLVGFPGETAAQFNDLVELVREVEFDHLGAFVFSPEENTEAVELPGQVPQAVAMRRRTRLMKVQSEIAIRKQEARVGTVDTVLTMKGGDAKGVAPARSAGQAPEVDGDVAVDGGRKVLKSGEWVRVRYTGFDGPVLSAKVV